MLGFTRSLRSYNDIYCKLFIFKYLQRKTLSSRREERSYKVCYAMRFKIPPWVGMTRCFSWFTPRCHHYIFIFKLINSR